MLMSFFASVAVGEVSDPVGVTLYTLMGHRKNGAPLWKVVLSICDMYVLNYHLLESFPLWDLCFFICVYEIIINRYGHFFFFTYDYY
jgi:hypothetical protein